MPGSNETGYIPFGRSRGVEQETVYCDLQARETSSCHGRSDTENLKCHIWKMQAMPMLSDRAPQSCTTRQSYHQIRFLVPNRAVTGRA